MKVLAVGGGSGGHVTPLVAVVGEVKKFQKQAEVRIWCDRSFRRQTETILKKANLDLRVDVVSAGKLRRYHHLSLWQHLTIPSIVLNNIFDVFKIGVGLVQSVVKMLIWRPDVVFAKGGFVCLPVGWAASLLRIPIVIHDSDAHPGLTSRLLSGRAHTIATGSPLEYYSYDKSKSHYTGIPIATDFRVYSSEEKAAAKQSLGFSSEKPLVVVTGGGLGALRINNAIAGSLEKLLKHCSVMLLSGSGQYASLRARLGADTKDFQLHEFVSSGMADVFGAADVVVARAGATSIAELAASGSAVILVPNAQLTGGHQLKNAVVYQDAEAALVVDDATIEKDEGLLPGTIIKLVKDEKARLELAANIKQFAKPNAAYEVASLVVAATKKQ